MQKSDEQLDISGGISFYPKKRTKPYQVSWLRSIDYRTDPNRWGLLPASVKESGSIVEGLVKWMARAIPRTDIVVSPTNLITNGSFESNTTGWDLDADYTRDNGDAYIGAYSVKQASTSGYANFYTTTAGITVEAYTDYLITFNRKVTVTSGLAPLFQVNTGSAFGTFLEGSYIPLNDTDSAWEQTSITINTGAQTTVWLRIFNNNGAVTAYYDNFSCVKIPKSSTYLYDDAGNFYERLSTGSYRLIKTVPASHGNGMEYFAEDDFIYTAGDRVIGRYGPLSYATPNSVDDFLGSEGGVPTNTHSISLTAASSQYAEAADSASLSVTGDLTLEAYIKPTTLPTSGNRMIIGSKWDESGATRSYSLELYATSSRFGDGSDGALTISSNTTESPIDSACSGVAGSYTLSATNASFAEGQVILIHQTQGTGHGTEQRTKIQSYSSGTITTTDPLNFNYNSTGSNRAQVRVLKQHTDVTINSGITYTAKAWNGTTGGILGFCYNGTYTNSGTITASEKGFRGGAGGHRDDTHATSGESYGGLGSTSTTASATIAANGGGGGNRGEYRSGSAGGSGAGYGSDGTDSAGGSTIVSSRGIAYGASDLSVADLGSGGGGAYNDGSTTTDGGNGGRGGGYILIEGPTCNPGAVVSNGGAGTVVSGFAGGSGSGGAIKFNVQTLGSMASVSAQGAASGGGSGAGVGGVGGSGRIHTNYLISSESNSTPVATISVDSTLISTTQYQVRLGLSSTGNNSEFLAKTLPIVVSRWQHIAVSWDASAASATFFLDAVSQGTVTGALTAIHNNGSAFILGAMENSGGTRNNFFDGLIDEFRIWASERTESQVRLNKDLELASGTANLKAYYQLDNGYTDGSGNANTLSDTGGPTFTTDIPFAAPTSRLDLDQSLDTSGNTYTLVAAINEGATHRQSFVPAKDPQKSIQVLVASVGTDPWTVTVHDALNRAVATATITAANMNTGDVEFIFSEPWRPVIGQTYHFHITQASADGTVTTTTSNDLETVDFHTYYQFLVTDTSSHAMTQMLNFMAICNERYLAKLQPGPTYNPHQLTFPAGFRSRCLGKWNEYLAIGVYRGTTIYDFDQGYIFFWDGTHTTYNFYIPVPEGGVNALYGSGGTLYIVAGYQGDVLAYTGGDRARKLFRLPKMTPDVYMEVLPGAITMWQALMRIGAGVSDSSSVERGVYTYGHVNEGDLDSLSYDYPISTGQRLGTVEVGCVYPIDQKLLISWRDGTTSGIDVVDPAGNPYTSGTIEFLMKDAGSVNQDKYLQVVRADYETLTEDQSVTLKYRMTRTGSWLTDTNETTNGVSRLNIPASAQRTHEYQVAVDITQSDGSSPYVLSVTAAVNPLTTEKDI